MSARPLTRIALICTVVWVHAVARPRGWRKAAAAIILLAVGRLAPAGDGAGVGLARVVKFLGAVLVLAKLCDDRPVRGSRRGHGSSSAGRTDCWQVFAVSAAITAALCLDATVVLLTPVVWRRSAGLRTVR